MPEPMESPGSRLDQWQDRFCRTIAFGTKFASSAIGMYAGRFGCPFVTGGRESDSCPLAITVAFTKVITLETKGLVTSCRIVLTTLQSSLGHMEAGTTPRVDDVSETVYRACVVVSSDSNPCEQEGVQCLSSV